MDIFQSFGSVHIFPLLENVQDSDSDRLIIVFSFERI